MTLVLDKIQEILEHFVLIFEEGKVICLLRTRGGCLFGQVLRDLGISIEYLAVKHNTEITYILADHDLNDNVLKEWTACIQYEQDHRVPWKDALAKADRIFPIILETYGDYIG